MQGNDGSETISQFEGESTLVTDGATGAATMMEDTGDDNLSDELSDTGWDTDLEIEGV